MAHNIFISYRRINGDIMARMICDGLRSTNRYGSIYLDVDDHTAGNYVETIDSHIMQSQTCILVLSKGALDRCVEEGDIVRHEIALAKEQGLKIVPIMITGNDYAFNGYPKDLPPDIEFIRTQNACIYHQATSAHYIDDLCSFIDAEDNTQKVKKKNPAFFFLPVVLELLIVLLLMIKNGSGLFTTARTRSVELGSRPVAECFSYWEFKLPYLAFGEDWKDGHLYCTRIGYESAYAEYELNGKYRKLSFDYIPFADEFYKNEEYGPNMMQVTVIDAKSGEILGESEWIDRDSEPGHLEVDVTGVERLRIIARRNGPMDEAVSDFSSNMILKNEILEP